MRDMLIKAGKDLKSNRQVESYATAFLTLTIAMLSFFGDIVSPDLRWATCTMGIGLLVLRSAAAEKDRVTGESVGEHQPLDVRIHHGERIVVEVWRHGPEHTEAPRHARAA